MAVEKKAVRNQMGLFVRTLDDLVPPGHLSRLVEEFVAGCGMERLGFRSRGRSESGAPSYPADMLLSVWIYGYFKRIRSSRQLERACRDDIGLIWLTGGQKPDHNTLWRFWNANAKAIGEVFKATVLTAVGSGLAGTELVALDGTKVLSAGGMRKGYVQTSLTKHAARLDREIATLEAEIAGSGTSQSAADAAMDGAAALLAEKQSSRARVSAALKTLDKSGQKALIPHEPQARSMKTPNGPRMGYNAQAAGDDSSGVLLAAELTDEANDAHQLTPMIAMVEENVGRAPSVTVADSGYNTLSEYGKAEAAGYEVLVYTSSEGEDRDLDRPRDGRPEAHEFIYDEQAKSVTCPRQGTLFTRTGNPKRRKDSQSTVVQVFTCRNMECPLRAACSKNKRGRVVEITNNHHLRARNMKRGKTPEGAKLLKRRKAIIEPVFGQIKHNEGFRKFTFMGLEKARTQWLFICAIHNLKKIFKHLAQAA